MRPYMTYTTDDFLGGLVRLKQDIDGYRATSDAVLLAAAVPAKSGESVLDVGCGTGAVALCLGARIAGLQLTGIDVQDQMTQRADENALLNGQKMSLITADVADDVPLLKGATFHHVVTNPPFFTETPQRQTLQRAVAHGQTVPLSIWLDFCLRHLRAKGTLTLIHRTECVPEILTCLQKRLGNIVLIPLYPKAGEPAKRVIIQGCLGTKKPFTFHAGFILHNADGTRTRTIEKVMRSAAPLF